jgi:hypothetical protein
MGLDLLACLECLWNIPIYVATTNPCKFSMCATGDGLVKVVHFSEIERKYEARHIDSIFRCVA